MFTTRHYEIKGPIYSPPEQNRDLPPRSTVEEFETCFVVRDHKGQQLAYVYFEEEPGRRSAAKLLSKCEARKILAMQLDRRAFSLAVLPKSTWLGGHTGGTR